MAYARTGTRTAPVGVRKPRRVRSRRCRSVSCHSRVRSASAAILTMRRGAFQLDPLQRGAREREIGRESVREKELIRTSSAPQRSPVQQRSNAIPYIIIHRELLLLPIVVVVVVVAVAAAAVVVVVVVRIGYRPFPPPPSRGSRLRVRTLRCCCALPFDVSKMPKIRYRLNVDDT
jgi:hypothetical protein